MKKLAIAACLCSFGLLYAQRGEPVRTKEQPTLAPPQVSAPAAADTRRPEPRARHTAPEPRRPEFKPVPDDLGLGKSKEKAWEEVDKDATLTSRGLKGAGLCEG